MISEDSVKKTLLFFFYGFLNDDAALEATKKTLRRWDRKSDEDENEADLVRFSYSVWKKSRKVSDMLALESEICQIPSSISLGSWRSFRKAASEDEFLMVLWAKVLGISERKIAMGLNVSTGTVRHRLSCGLRKLGSVSELAVGSINV